jgi:hypothetical protein
MLEPRQGIILLHSEGYDDMLQGYRSMEIGWSRNGVLGVLLDRDGPWSPGEWWFAGFRTYHRPRRGTRPEIRFWGVCRVDSCSSRRQ